MAFIGLFAVDGEPDSVHAPEPMQEGPDSSRSSEPLGDRHARFRILGTRSGTRADSAANLGASTGLGSGSGAGEKG